MKKNKKVFVFGFTLVELLVVMSIISILATVILGGFRASQRRSRDAKRKSDLEQVAKSLEMFYSDHGVYPASSGGELVGCAYNPTTPASSGTCSFGSEIDSEANFTDGDTIYFRRLPSDPTTDSNYYYRRIDNHRYQLFAHLENTEDPGCVNDGCTITGLPDVCGLDCNYAITSSNATPLETPAP